MENKSENKIAHLPLKRIDGTDTTLASFRGKVLLVVNVASKCGLTPQYDGLEKLYKSHRARGLEVLGFPANEFGAQEPGSNEEIHTFCRSTFGVDFPMFAKVVVKGEGQHPLYQHLTAALPEARYPAGSQMRARMDKYGHPRNTQGDVQWNFEKFLINRQGDVVARFSPDTTPEDPELLKAIEAELARA